MSDTTTPSNDRASDFDWKDLSLARLLQLLLRVCANMKLSALWALAGAIGYCVAMIFHFGAESRAIEIGSPFAMNIDADDTKIDLPVASLVRRVEQLAGANKIIYEIHRIDPTHPTAIQTVGIVSLEQHSATSSVARWIGAIHLIPEAYAQSLRFNWCGHEGNYSFNEKYISADTIERTYKDGWILRYQVDNRRNAIESSFHWQSGGCG